MIMQVTQTQLVELLGDKGIRDELNKEMSSERKIMTIGTITIASTPCCGLIQRSYECSPSETSETGWMHNPGGDYAPDPEDFGLIVEKLEWPGMCPDCGKSILPWLNVFGYFENGRWYYDHNLAQSFWGKKQKEKMLFLTEVDGIEMMQAKAIMKM